MIEATVIELAVSRGFVSEYEDGDRLPPGADVAEAVEYLAELSVDPQEFSSRFWRMAAEQARGSFESLAGISARPMLTGDSMSDYRLLRLRIQGRSRVDESTVNLRKLVAEQLPPDGHGMAAESFNESDHPRGDDGKFISKGAISAAKTDSSKAEKLFAKTTDPTERAKLEKAIGKEPEAKAKGQASDKVKSWASKRFKDPAHAKAFTDWFGDSKVVDENGEPLALFHGTSKEFSDENVFAPKKESGMSGGSRPGLYMIATPNTASAYASPGVTPEENKGARVYQVYVKMENPFITESYKFSAGASREDIEKLQADGYDGIIVNSDGYEMRESYEFVAFDSSQIKSATGNHGTFDPENPKITEQIDKQLTRAARARMIHESRGPTSEQVFEQLTDEYP